MKPQIDDSFRIDLLDAFDQRTTSHASNATVPRALRHRDGNAFVTPPETFPRARSAFRAPDRDVTPKGVRPLRLLSAHDVRRPCCDYNEDNETYTCHAYAPCPEKAYHILRALLLSLCMHPH